MQVGALGICGQKRMQRQWPLLRGGLVGVGGAGFGGGGLGVEKNGCGGENEAGEKAGWAAHDCLPV